MAITAALMVSLSFTHVFHEINITGIEMGEVYMGNHNSHVRSLLESITIACDKDQAPLICMIAAGCLPQISAISISLHALMTRRWSSVAFDRSMLALVFSWRSVSPNSVLYLVSPLVLVFTGINLDIKWGLSKPGLKAHFSSGVVITDTDLNKTWYAALDDKEYKIKALSPTPYRYVPYGLVAINAIDYYSLRYPRPQTQKLQYSEIHLTGQK